MPSTFSLTINDYDRQTGVVGGNIEQLSGANFGAAVANLDAFRLAVEQVTIGISIKQELSYQEKFQDPRIAAGNDLAQRGNKWRVAYYDDTQYLDAPTNAVPNPGFRKPFDIEIPCADLTYRIGNSDQVWALGSATNDPDMDALVSAFEDLVRSPYTGEAEVTFIEAVTRSGG